MSVYIPPIGDTNIRKVQATLHQLAQGGTNASGQFTLRANQTTTLTSFAAVTPTTTFVISWQPTTANAAAQMATMYCTGSIKGQFTINHASNTSTDQTFNFTVNG